MKNFKWLISLCALLFLISAFLLRSTDIQARASKVHAAASATSYQLASVATLASDDVWAVGKTGTGNSFSSLIEHWDGSSWQIVSSPDPEGATDTELTGVAALTSSDVWAVGFAQVNALQQSVVEHWDGCSWSLVSSPNQPGNTRLLGISALSSDDVWAVGVYQNSLSNLSLIEQWDGSQWQIVPSPNPSASFNELTGVSALSASDVWAVGNALGYAPGSSSGISAGVRPLSGGGGTFNGFHAVAEHWDGTAWNVVRVPDPPETLQQVYTSVIANASNDVWAVGHSFTNSNSFVLVAHWNGTSWQTVQSPTAGVNGTLTSITALSPQDIWAVGSYHVDANSMAIPLTEHWDGQQWTVIPSPNGNVGYVQANGVSGISSQDVWFVGDSGLSEQWDGTAWQIASTPTP